MTSNPQVAVPPTLAAVADGIAAAPDESERFRIMLEFVRTWREDEYAPDEREVLLAREPLPSGDARWDALLGALAEHFARAARLPIPAWALGPQRFLDRPFFPIGHRSVRTAALVASPAAFRRRGVFLDPESLATV